MESPRTRDPIPWLAGAPRARQSDQCRISTVTIANGAISTNCCRGSRSRGTSLGCGKCGCVTQWCFRQATLGRANRTDRPSVPPRHGVVLIATKRTAITAPSPVLRYVSCGIALTERMIRYPLDRYIGRRVDPAPYTYQGWRVARPDSHGQPARDNFGVPTYGPHSHLSYLLTDRPRG